MENNKKFNNILLWGIPTAFLLSTFLPITFPSIYFVVLKVIVSLAALVITYLLFTQKPRYYIIWMIAFLLIAFVFNPIIPLKALMGDTIHFALDAAIVFMLNWWFAFRSTN